MLVFVDRSGVDSLSFCPSYSLHSSESCCRRVQPDRSHKSCSKTGSHFHKAWLFPSFYYSNTVNGLRKSRPSLRSESKSVHFQLNDSFALYKKEKAENDRMLNETNDRLQKQLAELRSSHAKLTSQLDFSNKRFVFFLKVSSKNNPFSVLNS